MRIDIQARGFSLTEALLHAIHSAKLERATRAAVQRRQRLRRATLQTPGGTAVAR